MTLWAPNFGMSAEEMLFGSAMERIVEALDSTEESPNLASTDAQTQEYFRLYADDPVHFGRRELREQYAPDVQTMMRSVVQSRITLAQSANATGKTHAAARVIVWWFLSFPGAQVYTFAAPPEDNLKNLLWGEIGSIVEQHPHLFEAYQVSLPGMMIRRSAQSFITGVRIPNQGSEGGRKARFSGKHAPYILFVGDEGDAVPSEVYEAIESCMSGGIARMLILFNPREEAGPIYTMAKDRIGRMVHLSALRHPNVISGEEQIPGAVNRETTIRRINKWTRPLEQGEIVDGECFEVPDFLVGATADDDSGEPFPPLRREHRKITEQEFYYMVLGVYPKQSVRQLFSSEWIDAARARYDLYVAKYGQKPPVGVRPLLGQDVAEFGTDWNKTYLRWGGLLRKAGQWQGVDPLVTGERAAGIYAANNAEEAFIDATGVGASVPATMRRLGCTAWRIMVQSKNKILKEEGPDPWESVDPEEEPGQFDNVRSEMLWNFREWLRTDKGAMLPPEDFLLEEMRATSYEKIPVSGRIRVSSTDTISEKLPKRRSPDDLMAAALTFAPRPVPKAGEFGSYNYVRSENQDARRPMERSHAYR